MGMSMTERGTPPMMLEMHEGAVLAPITRRTPIPGQPSRHEYDGGVHMADGMPVRLSQHRGDEHVNRLQPRADNSAAETLPGTWLYGGLLRGHFGHFLRETVGRLWAWQDHGPFDGVVFLPHAVNPRPAIAADLAAMPALREVLRLLGIGVPLRVPTEPTRFERLAVPRQLLFEDGPNGALRAARLREMFRSMAAGPVALDGLSVPQIYVSRRRLGPMQGRFLMERLIETNFRRAGYAILHPERLPFMAQVAAYRDVDRIVFAEGSAIHLGIPLLRDDAEVGLLWRGREPHDTMRRFVRACGVANLREFWGINGFVRSLPPGVQPRPEPTPTVRPRFNPRNALTLPDFARIGAQLENTGFIPPGTWECPTAQQIEAAIRQGIAARQARAPKRHHSFVPLPPQTRTQGSDQVAETVE